MFGSNRFFQVLSGFLAFGFTILQGLDWLFKKYDIDGKWFNYVLIALFLSFIVSVIILFVNNKKIPAEKSKPKNKKGKLIRIGNVILTGLFLVLFLYFFRKSQSKENLLTEQLPQISNAFEKGTTYMFLKKLKLF
jgi:formate hydrogenlyase subunit 3/multisubunit Na+/H+ antiporter MnhD subunit